MFAFRHSPSFIYLLNFVSGIMKDHIDSSIHIQEEHQNIDIVSKWMMNIRQDDDYTVERFIREFENVCNTYEVRVLFGAIKEVLGINIRMFFSDLYCDTNFSNYFHTMLYQMIKHHITNIDFCVLGIPVNDYGLHNDSIYDIGLHATATYYINKSLKSKYHQWCTLNDRISLAKLMIHNIVKYNTRKTYLFLSLKTIKSDIRKAITSEIANANNIIIVDISKPKTTKKPNNPKLKS